MKDRVTVKDGKWIWPIIDQNSWQGQNDQKDLVSHILPYVKNRNIMVQAGGNCGFLLSTFVPHFNFVYTFEPDPVNFYCLSQNVTSDHVTKMQCCLGSEAKPVNVTQLVRPDRPHDIGGVHVSGEGHVPTIRIDDLNLTDCNLMQLDVEGYELNALLGAAKTINKFKPVLCVEFCEKWLNRYSTNFDDIYQFLGTLGYKLAATYKADKIFIHQDE
jgi:FkbM family methyltransferase